MTEKIEITAGSLDRCIGEMKARKLVGPVTTVFFLDYYDLDSVRDLDTRTLQLVNKKLSQQRFPTVDGSDVPLHAEESQNSLLSRRIGN